MAYLLRSQDTQHLILQNPISIASGDNFSIRIIGTPSQNANYWRPLGGSSFDDNAPRVLIFRGGRSRLTDASGANLEWFPALDISSITSIEFRRTSSTLEYLVDDIVISGTKTGNTSSFFDFKTLLANFGATAPYPCDCKLIEFEINGVVTNRYDPSASFDQGVLVDTVGGNNGTPVNFPTNFNDALIFYDDGDGAVEQQVVSEFSGTATVNVLASSQAEKRITASGDSLVTTTTTSSASKRVQLSGQSSVTTSSVSLFEKRGVFSGSATVNLTSEAYASKTTELSGNATVNVVASGTLIDGNFEIHSFSGGALITASASGQVLKVGLVSGQSTTHASASGQASKVAHVEGNATVTASTQSAISKIASVFGEAISHITASAIAAKRVVLSGASTVITTVYGQFFNTESNVETYQTIVQGRVRANPEVQGRVRANPEIEGTVKSTTIQGRVK